MTGEQDSAPHFAAGEMEAGSEAGAEEIRLEFYSICNLNYEFSLNLTPKDLGKATYLV